MDPFGGDGISQFLFTQQRAGGNVDQGRRCCDAAGSGSPEEKFLYVFIDHQHRPQWRRPATARSRYGRQQYPRAGSNPSGAEQVVHGQGAGNGGTIVINGHKTGRRGILKPLNERRAETVGGDMPVRPVGLHQGLNALFGNQEVGIDRTEPVGLQPAAPVGIGKQGRFRQQVVPFICLGVFKFIVIGKHGQHLRRQGTGGSRRRGKMSRFIPQRHFHGFPPNRNVVPQIFNSQRSTGLGYGFDDLAA